MPYELTFLGIVVALVFTGMTGLYPGGVIVPGYLVLFFDHPARIAATWIVALLTFFVYRLISGRLLLFGRRRFVFILLLGGFWTFLWLRILPSYLPRSVEFRVIGWIIPGLIANHFDRQGVLLTTASLVTVTVFIEIIGTIMGSIWT